MSIPAPHWDLTNVYPSLESQEFKTAIDGFKTQVADLEDYFEEVVNKTDASTPPDQLAPVIGDVVERFNAVYALSGTLEPTSTPLSAPTRVTKPPCASSLNTNRSACRCRT